LREYESLVGKRYGKLVVEKLLPSDGSGHRRWLCRCDCGKMYEARTGNLSSGHATSCGCNKSPDLTGKMFGRLRVLRRCEEKISRGSRQLVTWECECNCGRLIIRTSDSLHKSKECMCADCARKSSVGKAFEAAGFTQGTQLSKISDMTPSAANTSGCRGVYFHKKQKKWCAYLKFQGKLMRLGSYANFEDAVKARKRAEEEVFETFLEQMNVITEE